jgi:Pyridoxamine 5'-phosphate oxidase
MSEPVAERPAMREYGVDTPDWRPLPWSWAAERLERSRNLWVVTVSAAGRPHALPVWGVWDDAAPGFAWSSAPGARKTANIAANPRVCVMVDDTVECVSVEGRATRLTDAAEIDAWIERYLDKYRGEDVTADFLRANAIFAVEPELAFGVIERADEFATRATRWRFQP